MNPPPIEPQRGRFPLLLAVLFATALSVFVGSLIGAILGEFVAGAILAELPREDPFWWKGNWDRWIAYTPAALIGVAVLVWAFLALRRPRFRPVVSGFVALTGVGVIGLGAGAVVVMGHDALPEDFRILGKWARVRTVGLLVGVTTATVFNTLAMRWCERRFSPKV